MYYTDNSILPEYMDPLIITAAPYGPQFLPGDADIPVTWDEQVQAAVDCYEAGATVLHFHVRNPATGHGSVDFEQYNYLLERVKKAVPNLIIQVGGSISFSPKTDEAKAKWLDYDTRHMLTELTPKPEFVTVTTGTTLWDVMSMASREDVKGTHLDDPKVLAAWAGMVVDSTPAFYLEHLKRLRAHGIQPYFVPAHVHQWEIIERLIRAGIYMGPLNMCMAAYGGGTLGRNPFDVLNFLQRIPQNAVATIWSSMRGNHTLQAMGIILGLHVRVGNEDNIWGANRERSTTLQQIKGAVNVCKMFGRRVATAEQARNIMKVGVWYDSAEETLKALGMPPNPVDYNVGLQFWETDGKLRAGVVGSDSHPIAACLVPPVGATVAAARAKQS
ncbi:MAG TPA: 3-keto-5-aminohexanoate cleavage protein [Candidatus Acidoferrum sp.]|nr:3-keto-5-aminohexanoate cleavage protein [Candidatus Acidoferrum sp.]